MELLAVLQAIRVAKNEDVIVRDVRAGCAFRDPSENNKLVQNHVIDPGMKIHL